MYGLTQTTVPTEEPVTLAEARLHMRISTDYTDEDSLIEDVLIPAARQHCENETGRQFVTASWTMTLDAFPADDVIYLPRPPGATVTSVKYVDLDGDTQTLVDGTDYSTDFTTLVSTIVPFYNTVWPSARTQKAAVTIVYTAGYGAASAVPGALKAAVLMVVADLYEHRLLQHELPGRMEVKDNPTVARLLAAETVLEAA